MSECGMRALTLWQPWALLCAAGLKRAETRSWGTSYRGPVAIHAAKRWTNRMHEVAIELLYEVGGIARCSVREITGSDEDWLKLGHVVAVADLVACERMTAESIGAASRLERAVGHWAPGRFAWRLGNVEALRSPIPLRGAQGLFSVPAEIEREILAMRSEGSDR